MANRGEILLPAGTTFVTVGELPKLIAAALYPPVSEEPTLSYVLKHQSDGQPVPLSQEDLGELERIFEGMPPLVSGVPKAQWPEYAFAFVHASRKPDWHLVPVWNAPVLNSVILRTDAVEQHKRALAAAILDGQVISRTHSLVPLAPNDGSIPMARILIQDIERYVSVFGLKVHVANSSVAHFENPRLTGGGDYGRLRPKDREPHPPLQPDQPTGAPVRPETEIGSAEWRANNAKAAAEARHSQPGGSREKQETIRGIWATGKYSTRDICAEEECGGLGISFAAARRALKNTPEPNRS